MLPAVGGLVRSARLQMLATAPVGRRLFRCPVYRRFGYDYWQQLDTGELVVGGARDRGGESEWTSVAELSESVQAHLDDLVREVASEPESGPVEVTHRWAGIVGYTASGLPLVRALGDGIFVAGGYCGTGNVIGAIAGRAIVELALDGSSGQAELFDSAAT